MSSSVLQRLLLAALALLPTLGCDGPRQQHTSSVATSRTPARPSTRPVLGNPEPTTTPELVYRVGADVVEPVELIRVTPVPSEDCKDAIVRGIYIFEATIDPTGSVRNVRTVSRPSVVPPCPQYENECRRALAKWKYRPATLKGTPVPVFLTVTVSPRHR